MTLAKLSAYLDQFLSTRRMMAEADPLWSKISNGLRWHNLRFPRFSSNLQIVFAKAPVALTIKVPGS